MLCEQKNVSFLKDKWKMDVDELTIEMNDEETGELVIKQLDKRVLSKGAWSTVMFLYQERDAKTGEFGEPKVSLRRFQKNQGVFTLRGQFNISGKAQADMIVENLNKWYNN